VKVVCINNVELGRDSNGKTRHNMLPLTIGKTYEKIPDGQIIAQNVRFYMIEDNNGELRHYPAQNFLPIDTWREMQLNRIL
jgi:hypothetical protein